MPAPFMNLRVPKHKLYNRKDPKYAGLTSIEKSILESILKFCADFVELP
jgi:hypothetical protein